MILLNTITVVLVGIRSINYSFMLTRKFVRKNYHNFAFDWSDRIAHICISCVHGKIMKRDEFYLHIILCGCSAAIK